jgi:hypothetical protein
MTEALKRNFEPGRLLLIATLLMSLTLISQLYVISESMDLSNGLQLNGVEMSLVASYLFTALSMVIVINEFFQFKTKMKGLMMLNKLIFKEPQAPRTPMIISVPEIEVSNLGAVSDASNETDLEFEKLVNEELQVTKPEMNEALGKYATTKVKIDGEPVKVEPEIKEGGLQGFFDTIDEETEMDRMLAESEVIATLSELNNLVKELKQKRVPVIAQ